MLTRVNGEALLREWRLLTLAGGIVVIVIAVVLGILHLAGVITLPLSALGQAIVRGFIPLVITLIAFTSLLILSRALRSQTELRNRELDHQSSLAEADAVRRQGELVNAIRLRLAGDYGDSEEERQELATELVVAVERYHAIVSGFIRARPEIARLERDAIASYLAEARAELRRLRIEEQDPLSRVAPPAPLSPDRDAPLRFGPEHDPFDDDDLFTADDDEFALDEGEGRQR